MGAALRTRLSERMRKRLLVAIAVAAIALTGASPPPPAPKPSAERNDSAAPKHSQPAPRPGALEQEARHIARYDNAIRKAREHPVTAEDAKRIREAIAAVGKSQMGRVRALLEELTDPVQRKLVQWYSLYRGFGTVETYQAFLSANPGWPGRRVLQNRLETLLFEGPADAALIQKMLGNGEPQTGTGIALLTGLMKSKGDETRSVELARRAWREYDFPRRVEDMFLERFKEALRPEDHKRRVDRLLGGYVRWRSHRSGRIAAAGRVLGHMSKAEQAKVKARIAAYRESSSAPKLMRQLPKEKEVDWGLAFNKVQLFRRTGKKLEAQKILLSAPTDPGTIADLDGWWHERVLAAFDALKSDNAKVAYDLVRNAGPISVNEANEQAFLAGWLALRKLVKPKAALAHFEALAKTADGPLSRSRAAYWQGRTWEKLGDDGSARAAYARAAKFADTFDSHLARTKLGSGAHEIRIAFPSEPTAEQVEAFNALDSVHAAVIATKAGLSPHISRQFLNHLRRHFDSEAELAMSAHLAEALGDTQMAVRIGKSGNARGHNLTVYSYPVHAFPAYSPLRPPPETAILLGIARQESEFNTLTQSSAGARGLMQVMPITARHVCRDYKLKCDIGRLMKDKSYNTKLASAYIGDRMAEFDGSYVLSIAGYNAGPGRVRQWVQEFGDPRDKGVDPIDWIHRIPFEETRIYVQKVLSNLQIYRARLAEGAVKLKIAEDLNRTGPVHVPSEAVASKRAEAN
ncbi:MAG: hypothetical protein RLZ98_1049 [Pseudomonadota bacterium]